MSESSDRLDRIEKLVESNAKAILAVTEKVQAVAEGVQRTNDALTYSPRLEAGGFFRSHPLELLSQRVGLHQKPCDY
jgi:hypothetical protein